MEIKKRTKILPRGKFSMDVTLPAWWLQGHGLTAGSEVVLTATPNRIVIEPIKQEDNRNVSD